MLGAAGKVPTGREGERGLMTINQLVVGAAVKASAELFE